MSKPPSVTCDPICVFEPDFCAITVCFLAQKIVLKKNLN